MFENRRTDSLILEWRIYARTKQHQRRVHESLGIIKEATEKDVKWCVSWSGGKDSTAMVHLVKRIDESIPIIIQFDDCDWPEKEPYVERISRAFGWPLFECKPNFSVWEAALQYKVGEENLCATTHSLTRTAFLEPLEQLKRKLGCNGTMLGLRMKESKHRRLNAISRGSIYELVSGMWRCCPLQTWSARDCFAYLVSQDVEINPCYLNNQFESPEEIRLAWALPTPTSLRYGGMQHMRKYYPRHWERLCESKPELRRAS